MAKSKLSRIMTIIKEGLNLIRISVKASRFHHKNYFRVLKQGIRLGLKRDFLPDEAYRCGLLNPSLPEIELKKYCSKKRHVKIQGTINPDSWSPVTEDKSIFYKYCMALGVPIPRLYAVFYKNSTGWAYNDTLLKDKEDWIKFFEEVIPSKFVIKPCWGVYGDGFQMFSRKETGFIDAYGNSFHVGNLHERMLKDPKYESFVIQERLENHPEFVRLSGTQALQTIRMVTSIDSDMTPKLLYTALKIITGINIIDAFAYGKTGNLTATINPDGFLESVVSYGQEIPGIISFETHPDTGVRFDEFRIPLWDKACTLVKEVALKFLPIRSIGWDVAVTPDGVFVVEANMWPDPPNQFGILDKIVPLMTSDR
jgi:hypothetical protein